MMVSLDTLSLDQVADVVDSLRDAVEYNENAAEYWHSINDHSGAESFERDAAYLTKLADDIENGLTLVGEGQAMDIFDALTLSIENCAELGLDDAQDDYASARAAINEAVNKARV
jgi:hypothetical protein